MTPKMLRAVARISGALALVLALVWLLQEFAVVAWIDDPVPGMLGFAVLAILCQSLARKGKGSGRD